MDNEFDFFSAEEDIDSILAQFGADAEEAEPQLEKLSLPEEKPHAVPEVPPREASKPEMPPPRAQKPQKRAAEVRPGPDIRKKPEAAARSMPASAGERRRAPAQSRVPAKTAPRPAPKKKDSLFKRIIFGFTGVIFAGASLILLGWMLVNIHPDSALAASASSTAKTREDVVSRLDTYSNNSKASVLSDLTYIRKQYKIPEGNHKAPLADPSCFGETYDTNEVLAVIEKARQSGLLDNQSVIFSPNVEFYHNTPIYYYCDDTILVICWKEKIEGRVVTCSEVKIADASQFRRKICEDTYGSSVYVYASELARQTNAVVAMNADYYAFRDLGITVYDRQLYRFDEATYTGMYQKYNATDTLFINAKGEFVFFHKGEQTSREAMERFIADNDILFSIAFGPVLVENGVLQECDWYPVGEIFSEYSRAGIAQFDDLHYLYMAVSWSTENTPRCNVNQFAQYIYSKGVKNAYCFDGGQTGEIVFNGVPYNYIDFNAERTVSDIIYFGTAIPETEVFG